MSADLDLDAMHQLATDVDATRRLVTAADDLVGEILCRYRRLDRRIVDLADDNAETGSPATLDRVMDLSRIADLHRALFDIADQICTAIDEDPPSVGAGWGEQICELMEENEALRANLKAARRAVG